MDHLLWLQELMDFSGILVMLVTVIGVIALSYALDRLWADAMPVRAIYLFIRFPGIVLHECSHIVGCLVTGARIRKVVFFSKEGGSVTYSRPLLPYIGDVIIGTAPLVLLPLALTFITWIFGTFLGCVFPALPVTLSSSAALMDLESAIFNTLSENLLVRFNGWFLLYLYLTLSMVLSLAPSTRDLKNAAAGGLLMILAGILVLWSNIPPAVSLLTGLVRLLGYGFTLGLVFGLVGLTISLPLLLWYVFRRSI